MTLVMGVSNRGDYREIQNTHYRENFCARDWRWSIIPWGYLYFGKRRLVVCQGLAISGAWRLGCNQKDNIPWDNISWYMGHGQYVIRMYVFSLRLMISSTRKYFMFRFQGLCFSRVLRGWNGPDQLLSIISGSGKAVDWWLRGGCFVLFWDDGWEIGNCCLRSDQAPTISTYSQ